jgi:nicotinamide-nucleotide amidase
MPQRPLQTAELLAIGSELLVGETRDTNSGDLAAELSALGVEVRRLSALPDRLDDVVSALSEALSSADLVITTGGLGPTPDDLTREAIGAVCGEQPSVDPELESWLRRLFERRSVPFSSANLKQAWRIPSATAIPNGYGTAPGWWVERPDGRVMVALPGPPREMRPMWGDAVLPRLRARGLGADRAAETLRLTGIGESLLVDVIGEGILRATDPEVATYARVDAVDVRISAIGDAVRSAREKVDAMVEELLPRVGRYLFARGDEGWPEAIARRLAGRTLAGVEIGTGGQLAALLGSASWFVFSELLAPGGAMARTHRGARPYASRVRVAAGTDVGLAVRARERRGDMAVTIAVDDGRRATEVRRLAFLTGDQGRRRAVNLACAELWARLGTEAEVKAAEALAPGAALGAPPRRGPPGAGTTRTRGRSTRPSSRAGPRSAATR